MQGIGDFAEKLINEQVGNIKEGKELPPGAPSNGLAPAGKDISKVKVPDSFMKEVLGESFHPQDTPTTNSIPELVWSDSEEPEAPAQNPQVITEETVKQLVPLLEEVRDLLKEMTSTGSIGVNMAGPQKDSNSWDNIEKKYGYLTAKPSTLPGNTRKQILKKSIRDKLKRK